MSSRHDVQVADVVDQAEFEFGLDFWGAAALASALTDLAGSDGDADLRIAARTYVVLLAAGGFAPFKCENCSRPAYRVVEDALLCRSCEVTTTL